MNKLTIDAKTPTIDPTYLRGIEVWPKPTLGQQFAVTTKYSEGIVMRLLRKMGIVDGPLEVTKCYEINQAGDPVEIPCPSSNMK